MAVTSPPRPARTPPDGRPGRPPHSPTRSGGQLRVHWDRVAILAAIVLLIVVLIVVVVVRALSGVGGQGETAPATDPVAAAKATLGTPIPAETIPTVADASSVPSTVAKPCPAPAVKPIYAAPPLNGGDPSMRTVALTFDDGPGEFTVPSTGHPAREAGPGNLLRRRPYGRREARRAEGDRRLGPPDRQPHVVASHAPVIDGLESGDIGQGNHAHRSRDHYGHRSCALPVPPTRGCHQGSREDQPQRGPVDDDLVGGYPGLVRPEPRQAEVHATRSANGLRLG